MTTKIQSAQSSPPKGFTGPLTDLENARRFAQVHGHQLRYLSKSRQWLVWDGKCWRPDETGEIQRRAKGTVRAFLDAALKIDDPTTRLKQQGHALAAQRAGRIAGMILERCAG